MRVAVPVAILIASLTLFGTPWANQQIGEYRAHFELRSDLSKITPGQFLETEGGARVFFVESPSVPDGPLGQVFMRIIDPDWLTLITASSADTVIEANGDKFLVLGPGQRYDIKLGAPEMRLSKFDAFGARIESKDGEKSLETARERTLASRRSRPTELLLTDKVPASYGQLIAQGLAVFAVASAAITGGDAELRCLPRSSERAATHGDGVSGLHDFTSGTSRGRDTSKRSCADDHTLAHHFALRWLV
jgi:lipopolysaccharide export system permease protein